ncbi:MAG: amidohydrolase family protein [Verrucomicrobiota bacterium]
MIIDCDVHHHIPLNHLTECLPEPYKTEVETQGLRRVSSGLRFEDGGSRRDLQKISDGRFSWDPLFVREHHLDRYDIEHAILSGQNYPIAGIPDLEYVAALCSAYNDATLAKWIPIDPRYTMTLVVPMNDAELAVKEIERLGDHPAICAVGFHACTKVPFGKRSYWPIYRAATKYGLPIHIHPATTAVIANAASTGAGEATTYLESHVCMPQNYMGHLASLVLEGVFEEFPTLKVAMIEGGFGWMPHLIWRMDAEYKAIRHQAPRLRKMPSEYVRNHVKLGTQPIEEPFKKSHLVSLMEMFDGEDLLMFCSDYPHFDFNEPSVIPQSMSSEARNKILYENAKDLFRFAERSVPCLG